MKKLIAFHGKQEIKDIYVARVKSHQLADEIIKGQYWEDGKGCAVGCTLHSSDHMAYEIELGIPEQLARLEDSIFEGLPNDLAKQFPLQFIESISVGADLSVVHRKWLIWMLTDKDFGVIKYADTDACRIAIQTVSDLHQQEINGDVAWAVWVAWAAAWAAAAGDAARAAARIKQSEKLIQLLKEAK